MVRAKGLVLRTVATGLVVIACGFVGSMLFTRSNTLEVETSKLALTNFGIRKETELTFAVYNPSFFGAAQVLGVRGTCGLGCVEAVDFQSFKLESGESKNMTVKFKSPPVPGPIKAEFTLYYTANGKTRHHVLYVTGNAVDN